MFYIVVLSLLILFFYYNLKLYLMEFDHKKIKSKNKKL